MLTAFKSVTKNLPQKIPKMYSSIPQVILNIFWGSFGGIVWGVVLGADLRFILSVVGVGQTSQVPKAPIQSILDYAAANGGSQGHGRRLHVWRWESDIYYYGRRQHNAWEQLASDLSEWFGNHLEAFRLEKMVRDNIRVRGHKRSRIE